MGQGLCQYPLRELKTEAGFQDNITVHEHKLQISSTTKYYILLKLIKPTEEIFEKILNYQRYCFSNIALINTTKKSDHQKIGCFCLFCLFVCLILVMLQQHP